MKMRRLLKKYFWEGSRAGKIKFNHKDIGSPNTPAAFLWWIWCPSVSLWDAFLGQPEPLHWERKLWPLVSYGVGKESLQWQSKEIWSLIRQRLWLANTCLYCIISCTYGQKCNAPTLAIYRYAILYLTASFCNFLYKFFHAIYFEHIFPFLNFTRPSLSSYPYYDYVLFFL